MSLKKYIIWIITCVYLTTVTSADTGPKTVQKVDLNRYAGMWHEAARMPNPFEDKSAEKITAQYSLNSDGTIRVENRCMVKGKWQKVIGVARVTDRSTNAKLEVSFFSILGLRPVWGDYWIIGLSEDYTCSVVGDRNRKYAWILSRTPQLNETDKAKALAALKDNGYDINKLIYPNRSETLHNNQ